MSNPNSPESLQELPLPYDISAAVAQALRINSASSFDGAAPFYPCASGTREYPVKRSTTNHGATIDVPYKMVSQTTEEAYEELIPELGPENFLDEVFDNLSLPDMDTDAWSEGVDTNREELERFCKFIGGDEHEDRVSSSLSLLQSPRSKPRTSAGRRTLSQPIHTVPTSYAPPVVDLVNARLWREFNMIGTEMVITKNGRRMFPAVMLSIKGLHPTAVYSIYLDIVPTDDRRYKFMQTEWVAVGKADKKFVYKEYPHPDCPNTGSHWMEKPVSFKMLKLTNNQSTTNNDQIILNSMQRYQPTVRIVCKSDNTHPNTHVYQFPEMAFIAVTAYQNSKITDLKISYNPYARAFRESVPSQDGHERKGGHYKPPTSPTPRTPAKIPGRGSTTSVESGFESGESSELLPPALPYAPIPPAFSPVEFYQPANSYWVDEYSLYHSALIYPPPVLDAATSFSDPYLRQTSRVRHESTQSSTSPVKPLPSTKRQPNEPDSDDVFI